MAADLVLYFSSTHLKLCRVEKRMYEMNNQDFLFPSRCESAYMCPCVLLSPTQAQFFLYFCFLCDPGSIVSVGDPKKKYTRFEKIGQG